MLSIALYFIVILPQLNRSRTNANTRNTDHTNEPVSFTNYKNRFILEKIKKNYFWVAWL